MFVLESPFNTFVTDVIFAIMIALLGATASVVVLDYFLYDINIQYYTKTYPPVVLTLLQSLISIMLLTGYLFCFRSRHSRAGVVLSQILPIILNFKQDYLFGELSLTSFLQGATYLSLFIFAFMLLKKRFAIPDSQFNA